MWVDFFTDILTNIDFETLDSVSLRYHYGELRLSRLNLIYRFSPHTFSVHNFIYGFMSEPLGSKVFLVGNFAWLISFFWLVTIATSAMQVGIGTSLLGENKLFQGVSVVFVVASLVGVAASVMLIGSVWVFLAIYHILRAKRNLMTVQKSRG